MTSKQFNPTKGLGMYQRKCLRFYKKLDGARHTFDSDTRKIALSLQKRGLLEVTKYNQARWTGIS